MMSGDLLELNTRVDVLMLGYFCSDALVGIYSFVAILAEAFSQIPLAIRTCVDPILGELFSEKKIEGINQLVRNIKRKFYPFILAAGILVIVLYPVLHILWINDNQLPLYWITLTIIMSGVILNAAFRSFGGLHLQGVRPGIFKYLITILIVSDALLNLIFIPIWGIYSAAAVTSFTYALEAGLLIIFSKKFLG
ncbi:MAG: lipopolysaccharide biosynthesis protein [Anaerolineaceae bacterium]